MKECEGNNFRWEILKVYFFDGKIRDRILLRFPLYSEQIVEREKVKEMKLRQKFSLLNKNIYNKRSHEHFPI